MSALLRRPGRVPGKTADSSAPYALELPNEESLSALANVAAGNVRSFDSVDEMKAYFDKAEVESSPEFAVDLKREKKGKYGPAVKKKFWPIVDAIAAGQEWAGCCDCHIKPNLLLIYQKIRRPFTTCEVV